MAQGDVLEKLIELEASSFDTGFTAKDVAYELGREGGLPSVFRNLKDLKKNKFVECAGFPRKFWVI